MESLKRIARPTKGFSYQQTMIRVKDPKPTLDYYTKHFGMKIVAQRHFVQWKFSLYFLGSFPDDHVLPFEPESNEAFEWLNQINSTVLEITHNHGTEIDPDFKHHNGNSDPRGFGHIGFIVDDVDSFCDKLIADGVKFQKKPTDGNMRSIAFALDPDNYWVEILPRSKNMPATEIVGKPSFQQTMIRIKDPKLSIPFYESLGCTIVNELHFP